MALVRHTVKFITIPMSDSTKEVTMQIKAVKKQYTFTLGEA